MIKIGHTGKCTKILSYLMAALLVFLQPCCVYAAEMEQPPVDNMVSVKYIVAFEALAEEDASFSYMYKPTLEELSGIFPETILVWLEGEETPAELTVVWECEDDFDTTEQPYYLFYPKWDETRYTVAESVKESVEIPAVTVEVPQGGGTIMNPEEAKNSLYQIIQKKAVLASIYLCDEYEVKAAPSPDSETIHTAVSGQSVQITDVESDVYGGIWYQVLLYRNGAEYTGYVERDYLATSDEDFARWEEAYLDLSALPMVMALSEGCPDIDQFPASYQNALYALKEKHPDWTFVRIDTGLDWNTVIANELGDKSWILSSRSGSWQNGSTSQRGWSYASEGILKYYMDPRNFLDDSHIFQFEQLTYNSSYHTEDAVQEILAGSFMASAIPDDGRTYAQAFTAIGQELGVSPFHLASRVLQEQGQKGNSALISGTYPEYEGYYNFFNISASGIDNTEIIRKGLMKARAEGWNTRYASLYGGSKIIGNQYILWGQDTLYLEKFNVSNGKYANYTHQYMQNIEAPYYESANIYKAYHKAGVLEKRFVFKIPVYENMPASACAQPEKTDAVTLDKTEISSLEVDKSITLIPYVNGSKVDYVSDMIFTSSNTAVAVVDAQGKVTALSPGTAVVTCTRSGASSANCTVTVVKTDPVVSTPVLSPVTYREGIKLSDVALPDGWVWADGNTAISVGTSAYAAVYTPSDTAKYNTVTKDISFTVTKAIPACQVPAGLEVKRGAALGSIALPVGFFWESDAETVLTSAGEYTFYVSYNPDENNYYTVSHIPIIVQVKETVTEQPSGGNGSGNSGGAGNEAGSGGTSGGGSGTGAGNDGSGGTDTGNGSGIGAGSGNSSGAGSGNGGTGSTSGGGTQPPTSGGSMASGNISPSVSAGSTTAGNPQPPASAGNAQQGGAAAGTSQPPASAGNAQQGGAAAGTSQPPASAGNAQQGGAAAGTSQPPASAGNAQQGGAAAGTSQQSASADNAQQESTTDGNERQNTPSDNTANENPPPGGPAENETSGNPQQGSAPSNHASAEKIQPDTSAAMPPTGNPQPSAATGTSAGNTSDTASNSSTAAVINENGTINEGENTQSGEEAGSTGQPDEAGYFRPAVTIQMEDTTILTTEKMRMAKEQNFDLLLDMGGAVTWSIDVDSIDEGAIAEVDMGIALGTNNVPQELVSAVLNGNKYLEITLAHQGEFGFEPVLNIALGKEYSGKYANLFYYDPETETLEFICDAVIGLDGVASLRFEHASCYLIVVSDQSMSGVSLEDESVNHLTRWIVIGVLICMLLVIAGYGIFFFLKKRQEEEEGYEEDDEDIDEGYEEDEDVGYGKYEGNDIDDINDTAGNSVELEEEDNAQEEILQKPLKANDAEAEEEGYFDEDDWIEDEDWQEPEPKPSENASMDSHEENDWLDDDWNAEDDWIEDDEWME